MDNSVPIDLKVPNKTYTALVWHSSYYNHTSGLKCTTIIIQELSKVCQAKVFFPKYEEWTSACISGRLYFEMCSTNKLAVIYQGQKMNKKLTGIMQRLRSTPEGLVQVTSRERMPSTSQYFI